MNAKYYQVRYRFDGVTAGETRLIIVRAYTMADVLTRLELKWKISVNRNVMIEDIEPFEGDIIGLEVL